MYPHAYRDHWVAQQYLPSALMGRVFYNPSTQGYEAKIREEVLSRREVQLAAFLNRDNLEWWEEGGSKKLPSPVDGADFGMHPAPDADDLTEENLTFTPESRTKNAVLDKAERQWRSRLDSNRAELLSKIRSELLSASPLLRHSRALVWNADDALLIFDIARKVPEGSAYAVCRTQQGLEILRQYSSTLEELDRPMFALSSGNPFESDGFQKTCTAFGDVQFDRIYFRDVFSSRESIVNAAGLFSSGSPFLADGCTILLSQKIPKNGQRISRLILEQCDPKMISDEAEAALKQMKIFEEDFFNDADSRLFNWDADFIKGALEEKGLAVSCKTAAMKEKRRISASEIERWFNAGNSDYGKKLNAALGEEDTLLLKNILLTNAQKILFTWESENSFWCIKRK